MDDLEHATGHAASPAWITDALRAGRCVPDRVFDSYLPEDLRYVSQDQWTPLEVVQTAARWLADAGIRRVIDIGSGPGKFCVAAALAGSCELIGLEQDPRLSSVARSLARLFGVQDRVRFVHGALGASALPEADAYYIYNPFAQHLLPPIDGIGCEARPDYERYGVDVMLAQDVFRRAPVGTLVLTYNGFGGLMPASYEACRVTRELPCVLRSWRKSEPWDSGGYSTVDAD
jgi:SAM-dependent methyltransferase